MLSSPRPVLNAPDGAAVMFSLPIGVGWMPAISQFDTAQPIVTSVASSIETSIHSPSPVRPRRTNAAAMAKAAVIPPIVSQTG